MQVCDKTREHIEFLAKLLTDETDWLIIKKQLLLMMSPIDRKSFTTRDPKTKRHHPFNEFEQSIRSCWKELTGNTLLMPEDKMMDGVDPKRYL